MGAPRPAASPFLAHDYCTRYGCERSPSRQAKTIHFAVDGGCRADESGTQFDWKKRSRLYSARRAPPVLSVYSAWRPRIEYFSLIVAEGSQNSVRKSRSMLILRKKAAR